MQMTSNQPYMLRAFYEWIVDNNLTPYIVVDASVSGVMVPQEHIKDGQIVLNISPDACVKLQMSNLEVAFEARFAGVPRKLTVPCQAIQAIYAKENGAGTVFTFEDEMVGAQDSALPSEPSVTESTDDTRQKKKPTLTVVK